MQDRGRHDDYLRKLCPVAPIFTAPARPWQEYRVGDALMRFPSFWAFLFYLLSLEFGRRQGLTVNAMLGFWN